MPDVDEDMPLNPMDLPNRRTQGFRTKNKESRRIVALHAMEKCLRESSLASHSTTRSRKQQGCPVLPLQRRALRSCQSTLGTEMGALDPTNQSEDHIHT